jgi:Protein of Unknown function (DUF2784)
VWFPVLADAVDILHVAFVVFVILGGLLVIRWPRVAWFHLPAAAWGAFVELDDRICPLTPLENWLRQQSGAAMYASDFVGHYLLPVLYPESLTRAVQLTLGTLVVVVNATVYFASWRRARRVREGSQQ